MLSSALMIISNTNPRPDQPRTGLVPMPAALNFGFVSFGQIQLGIGVPISKKYPIGMPEILQASIRNCCEMDMGKPGGILWLTKRNRRQPTSAGVSKVTLYDRLMQVGPAWLIVKLDFGGRDGIAVRTFTPSQ